MEIGKACCSLVLAFHETLREMAGKIYKLKLTFFRLLWRCLL